MPNIYDHILLNIITHRYISFTGEKRTRKTEKRERETRKERTTG